ncbi:IncQ-type mobilization protein MobB, partial [Kingella kingae]
ARSAARGWTWRLWAGVLIASVTPILALLIASWLWLEPQIIEQQGGIWLIFKLK